MRHPANSWSVGLTSKVSLSSHSGLSKQFKFAGCLNPRFGDGKKRYFPGSISPKSKRPILSVVRLPICVCCHHQYRKHPFHTYVSTPARDFATLSTLPSSSQNP